MNTNGAKIAAVVLTWNDYVMTLKCLDSLWAFRHLLFPIIVVDNGSDPPVVPKISSRYPELEMVELDKNYGFTGGCNRGLERAMDLGADYIFLLNNDTIVPPGAVEQLVAVMKANSDAALAIPLVVYPGSEKRVDFYYGAIHRGCARHVHYGGGRPARDLERNTRETEFAPACAIMLRTDALRQVGLFDESLFTNWEDYDLCIRLADAGWRLLSVGEAEVIHDHGQTTGKKSPFITYFHTRNRLICLFRHASKREILGNALLILRSYKWQISGQGWTNWPAYAAMFKGMWDFLLGRRGGDRAPVKRSD